MQKKVVGSDWLQGEVFVAVRPKAWLEIRWGQQETSRGMK